MILRSDKLRRQPEKIEARRTRAASTLVSAKSVRQGMGIVFVESKSAEELIMPI